MSILDTHAHTPCASLSCPCYNSLGRSYADGMRDESSLSKRGHATYLVSSRLVSFRVVWCGVVYQGPESGSREASLGVVDGDSYHERSSSGDNDSREREQVLPAGHRGDADGDYMSKGELASLIHEGARAILQSQVWYGMVWYGMVWYGMVWYGMVRW